MQGIKRMHEKPNYGTDSILIIFSVYYKYIFDVENIELKYVIDAMRYLYFFHDDSYKYILYLVEGKNTKEQSMFKVKIIKKSDKN